MTTARKSRTHETREADVIHDEYADSWEEKGVLDTKDIPARDGFVQRWVRTMIKGEDDQNNIFRKINQGWKPRLMSTVPKGLYVPNIDFQGTDVIGIHGMILMERPERQHESQAKSNRAATANQMSAVKQNIFNVKEEKGMIAPAMKSKSSVSKGRMPDFDD